MDIHTHKHIDSHKYKHIDTQDLYTHQCLNRNIYTHIYDIYHIYICKTHAKICKSKLVIADTLLYTANEMCF